MKTGIIYPSSVTFGKRGPSPLSLRDRLVARLKRNGMKPSFFPWRSRAVMREINHLFQLLAKYEFFIKG